MATTAHSSGYRITRAHVKAARKTRAAIATFEAKRDLVTLGAYAKGTDRELDDAIARHPKIESFLRQEPSEISPFQTTVAALNDLAR